ncbi:MAG TPA: hypothetical protein DCZ11_04210 [Gammaproteobacteria bacterium]|nr:hypothetical protein [Gammaproteobacteria bacterium]MCH77629.1 hypothetical protein [Gammaproteobacteria bacterium]
MFRSALPFVFLGLPLLEIYLLLRAATVIGALNTLLLMVLGVFVGISVVRYRGLLGLQRLRAGLGSGGLPAAPMLDTALAQLGGILLIVPGFITDAAGLCLQLALVRRAVVRRLLGDAGDGAPDTQVIEGEFQRRDDDDRQ